MVLATADLLPADPADQMRELVDLLPADPADQMRELVDLLLGDPVVVQEALEEMLADLLLAVRVVDLEAQAEAALRQSR